MTSRPEDAVYFTRRIADISADLAAAHEAGQRDRATISILSELVTAPTRAIFAQRLATGLLRAFNAQRALVADEFSEPLATAGGLRGSYPRKPWPESVRVGTTESLNVLFAGGRGGYVAATLGDHGYFYVDGIKDITGIDASARVVANTATIVAAALDTREKLANAAYLDELTGIANRRGYTKLLREAIEKGERFAFLFIDLDGFKLINDLQSHEAGDRHLIKTAHTLRSLVKLPGRVGGDEFAAIVDPSSEPEAIAKSLNKAGIPCSVGVVYFPDDGSDVETLFRVGDERMYAQKQARKATRDA